MSHPIAANTPPARAGEPPRANLDADDSKERWDDDGGHGQPQGVTSPEGTTAHLNRTAPMRSPSVMRGVVRQLKHLSAGTDIPSTHLIAAHNSVGYGYIRTPEGDVFFDASAVTNVRFDRMTRNMTVEFMLDDAPYLRTSKVTVIPLPSIDAV